MLVPVTHQQNDNKSNRKNIEVVPRNTIHKVHQNHGEAETMIIATFTGEKLLE